MRLESSEGKSFSLNVVRYEFPDEELGPNKDNPAEDFDCGRFLIVSVSLRTADGDWNATAPEMTTTQLECLANWLESVATHRPCELGVYFTERDLEFTLDQERQVLNVHLMSDFLPPWSNTDTCTVGFPIREIDLARAVQTIRSQLTQFPHRPVSSPFDGDTP